MSSGRAASFIGIPAGANWPALALFSRHCHARAGPWEVAMDDAAPETVTAALLVIGDEILSGRTKDKNIGYIAEYLTNIGVDLKEVRVVADAESAIVEALDTLRRRYTYVFTTGGIG